MSFEYTFEDVNDRIYFAYSEPYTYTRLLRLIQSLKEEQVKDVEFGILCKSPGGIEVPVITVTSKGSKYLPDPEQVNEIMEKESLEIRQEVMKEFADENKKLLIVTARIHPGETCSSFVMEGFIRYIISSSPIATELRNKFIIKIIPMLNIDGVIVGNYRCCIIGQDLNRRFANPNTKLHPVICSIKTMISNYHVKGKKVFAYIDLHGHSRKKCSFIYGPYYPLHLNSYIRVRILPKLLSERTHMFRYAACRFRQENSKRNTARLVISREFDVTNSLTLESSFYAFFNEDRKEIEFSSRFYEKMGEHLGGGLVEYTQLLDEERIQKCKRIVENRKRRRCIQKAKGRTKVKEKSPRVENKTKGELKEVNPNEGDKEVIRLEEYYENENEFTEVKEHKRYCMEDLCEDIKQNIQNEDMNDYDSDLSDTSGGEFFTNEEEKVITPQNNNIKEAHIPNERKEMTKNVSLCEGVTYHLRGSSQRFYFKPPGILKKKPKEKKEVTVSRQIYINETIRDNETEIIMKNLR